jgi:hypothetical protein
VDWRSKPEREPAILQAGLFRSRLNKVLGFSFSKPLSRRFAAGLVFGLVFFVFIYVATVFWPRLLPCILFQILNLGKNK